VTEPLAPPPVPDTITAVLFDFGGVFTPSPFSVVRAAAIELGISEQVAVELCFGPYAEDGDHPWHRLERGEVRLDVAHQELLALASAAGVEIDVFRVLAKIGREDEGRVLMVEGVRALRDAGYRTALVTNNVAEFGDGWRQLIPVDELFEVVIDSCEVGVRKPDPQIFRIALEQLHGVRPEQAVFLDDFEANVASARQVGMHGIVVGEDRAEALARLEALLSPSGEPGQPADRTAG
jgi:epoxide hydrolase-like predicted phosphatase